ncbi:AAA family ATPase [Spirosoma endophyticum]|uniref:Predicted ATPase n=1 Tax=Spirosoma endophyticum TaxID=662367 RepID=A0A1I1STC9_9BACT|nr:AAA family ATPase [Spirosoma endophyticum]SFD49714.1 Predicted ATPase [Spirosoma endophyticum]
MLKRVSIQNFKSLKDVTLDLQKVNLLIGPNNSGKTNFLKALEGFSIGGIGSENIEVLEAVSFKHKRVNINYEFEFWPDSEGYMAKRYTELRDKVYHYKQYYGIKSGDDYITIETKIEDWFAEKDGGKIHIETLSGHRREFFDFKQTKIFRPDPTKLVQQVKLSADQIQLLADCSNLIAFFYYVDNNFRNTYARQIKEDFSKCIPEIAYFTLPPVKVGTDSLLGLRFFDKEDNGYWADEVSEGVLYFLALLCIINQPTPPKLLLLEEPERGIHPRRIREVMDFIFRLADEKDVQIILTSHNEHVLDDFATRPEAVFVFDKDEEGATYVRNLQKDIIEPTNQRNRELGLDEIDLTTNLSENWLYGLLGGVPAIP